jgi:hypothetical protein
MVVNTTKNISKVAVWRTATSIVFIVNLQLLKPCMNNI